MLKIDPSIVARLMACRCKEDLHCFLQNAIELEHATIPPYLTALYSLIPGRNDEIGGLILSVVKEEMLHMTIVANILVATGGKPRINHPDFIPSYPGHLPMGIAQSLVVPIKAFSLDLVKQVFMEIESPVDPIDIKPAGLVVGEPEYETIGTFYKAIQEKICELGNEIFVVGPDMQVLSWFDPDENIPIIDVDSAIKSISLIIEEGEGSSTSPFVDYSTLPSSCEEIGKAPPTADQVPPQGDAPEVGHYYKFEEIYEGRKICPDGKGGFSFSGAEVPFDKGGVYPVIDNPAPSDYAPGSPAQTLSDTFSFGYSNLLNSLHDSFNGNPSAIDSAIGLMYQLRLDAQKLMTTPVAPDSPRTAGPVYRYVTSNQPDAT